MPNLTTYEVKELYRVKRPFGHINCTTNARMFVDKTYSQRHTPWIYNPEGHRQCKICKSHVTSNIDQMILDGRSVTEIIQETKQRYDITITKQNIQNHKNKHLNIEDRATWAYRLEQNRKQQERREFNMKVQQKIRDINAQVLFLDKVIECAEESIKQFPPRVDQGIRALSLKKDILQETDNKSPVEIIIQTNQDFSFLEKVIEKMSPSARKELLETVRMLKEEEIKQQIVISTKVPKTPYKDTDPKTVLELKPITSIVKPNGGSK